MSSPKARGQGCQGGSPRGAGVSVGVFLLRPQRRRQHPWEAQLGRAGRSQAGGGGGSLKHRRGPSFLPCTRSVGPRARGSRPELGSREEGVCVQRALYL